MNKKIAIATLLGAATFCCALPLTQAGCTPSSMTTSDTFDTLVHKQYNVVSRPTPNLGEGINTVEGIILHHTAEPTAESAMTRKLCNPNESVSSHLVIDTDGTRYVLAPPTAICWHAGKSRLGNKEGCNNFTIGIELQGNTLETPLTDDQIASCIQYIIPLMKEYNIPITNIVTHEMIRRNWKRAHPTGRAYDKPDITQTEYKRFMTILKRQLELQ